MYLGIDLGTTNMKAALYDGNMTLLDRDSAAVEYVREKGFVEFDAEEYFERLIGLLRGLVQGRELRGMALTGQAETLICLDSGGKPLMNAISWMDERSVAECKYLSGRFSGEEIEEVTGQQSVLPTWPATKLMWLRRNRPDIFDKTDKFVLLKDYIAYRLTGVLAADMSIATFTLYFDIYRKRYWPEMLKELGVSEERLPKLAEPCTELGGLLPAVAERLGIREKVPVNIGTLDHFAGMIGTGNLRPGSITLSTGTVMALAVMAEEPAPRHSGIAMHYGFLPDTHVMLPVAESGGVSLEWFRNACMPGTSFSEIDEKAAEREDNGIVFLPYIVGVNAPEFDPEAAGAFWGLRQEHDAFDMARAVMEGVSMLLRKNCDKIRESGTTPRAIVATGGGARSPVWCQMQADATGVPVRIPREREAAAFGAAIIAAAGDGSFESLSEAAGAVKTEREFSPRQNAGLEEKYSRFLRLYDFSVELRKK